MHVVSIDDVAIFVKQNDFSMHYQNIIGQLSGMEEIWFSQFEMKIENVTNQFDS